MFRIKTDIRQYKCETKDKVEKLIRNWVIRPTDLIYDADGKDWAPIGEHPAFVNLFGLLDEQEKNTPDTVVTRRSPYVNGGAEVEDELELDVPDDDETDDEIGPSQAALDVVEEVTQLVDRGDVTEDEDEDEPEIEEEAPEVTQLVGRPTVADSEAEESDARATDVFEQEEIAASLAEESRPKPPEAPEGVEIPTRDGEVTMMTERTLEMLKITDEDEAIGESNGKDDADDEDEDEAEDQDEDEEVTGVRARSENAEDEDEGEAEEDEDSDVDEEKETEEQKRDPIPLPKLKKPKALESGPKLGRHDLPEELFATNEISSPEVQEQLKRLDELGEIEPSDPTLTDDDVTPASGEWPASRLHEDSGVDEAWEEIAEDLAEEGDDDLPDSLPEGEDRDEYEDEGEWAEEDTGDHDLPPKEFVSDGYRVALPFPVRPTADDIRRGMPQGRVSKNAKDRAFPLPEPKKPGDVHVRHFDLTKKAPRDQTVLVIAVVAVIIVLIAVAVASC